MPASNILAISDPYQHARLSKGFRLSQQTWLELATTPFHELTADSSLRMLVTSGQIVQQSAVNMVYLYAVVFHDDKVLMQRKTTEAATAELEMCVVWTVPHHGQPLLPGDKGGKCSVKDAMVRFMRDEVSILGNPDSAYLMKAILPIHKGPVVVAMVRIEVRQHDLQGEQTLKTGEWLSREQVEEMKDSEVHPDGLKQLIIEAFEQKQFEDDVLAE